MQQQPLYHLGLLTHAWNREDGYCSNQCFDQYLLPSYWAAYKAGKYYICLSKLDAFSYNGQRSLVKLHFYRDIPFCFLYYFHCKVLAFCGHLRLYCYGSRFFYNLQESVLGKTIWFTWLLSPACWSIIWRVEMSYI